MGQDPSTIRNEIEQTREEMGDTVEALAYKADVKTRAKENVSGKVDSIKEKVTGAGSRVSDATPDADQVKGQARQAVGVAQENPLGLAIGAVAVGFVAGLLVPVSRAEERKLAPVAGELREKVTDTAQTAVEHGKEVAQEAVQSATETVKEKAPEHAEQVKAQAQA
jgi:gas vesicle protein